MREKTVILDKCAGMATITLNRPDAMNSLNQKLADDFIEVLSYVQNNSKIRVAVMTGNGKAFCVDGDLFYLASIISPNAA